MNRQFVKKHTKGFVGRGNNCFSIARNRLEKALQYSYRDRKAKKRTLRSNFIVQLGNATRIHGVSYSQFMHGLVVNNIHLNRKMLADLSVNEPYSFQAIVEQVKDTIKVKNLEDKRVTSLPDKIKHLPMDWETMKKYVQLHDELEQISSESNNDDRVSLLIQESLKKAKEQNIKDLIAGKYKIPTPVHELKSKNDENNSKAKKPK